MCSLVLHTNSEKQFSILALLVISQWLKSKTAAFLNNLYSGCKNSLCPWHPFLYIFIYKNHSTYPLNNACNVKAVENIIWTCCAFTPLLKCKKQDICGICKFMGHSCSCFPLKAFPLNLSRLFQEGISQCDRETAMCNCVNDPFI